VAAPALVPALGAGRALAAANGRIELARTVAFAGGPALAGALVGWTGGAPAFGVAAGLSAAAVVLLAGVREPARPLIAGRRVLPRSARRPRGSSSAIRCCGPSSSRSSCSTPRFFMLQRCTCRTAVHHLGLSAFGVGATLATYGVGMVRRRAADAADHPRVAVRRRRGARADRRARGGGGDGAPRSGSRWELWRGVSFFLIGTGPIVWVISTATLRQTVTPREPARTRVGHQHHGLRRRDRSAPRSARSWAPCSGAETCLVVAAAGFLVQALVNPSPRPCGGSSASPRLVG